MFPRFTIAGACVLCCAAPWAMAQAPASAEFDERGAALTLAQAAALAIARNPALEIYPWDVRAAEARALQASLWPNPELALEVEELRLSEGARSTQRGLALGTNGVAFDQSRASGASSGLDDAEITLRVSQRFPLGGKLRRGVEVAQSEKALAEIDGTVALFDVMRDVAVTFASVLAAQERVAEMRTLLDVAESFEETIALRVEAGKGSAIELHGAEVRTAESRIALTQAERALQESRAALASTWGAASAEFESAAGALREADALPPLNGLYERVESNPDLQRWQHELARREAAVALARARRVPDLTASLGFVTQGVDDSRARGFGFGTNSLFVSRSWTTLDDDREHRLEFEVSIPLPIFDRNQGNIREAELFVERLAAERAVTAVGIRAAIARWYERAMAAYETVAALESDALPAASDALELSRIGYEEGKFGYLDLLRAQENYASLSVRLIDAYEAYHRADAELDRLLGEPIIDIDED